MELINIDVMMIFALLLCIDCIIVCLHYFYVLIVLLYAPPRMHLE